MPTESDWLLEAAAGGCRCAAGGQESRNEATGWS